MDDSADFGTPGNTESPGANQILAQPPLQPAGDGSEGIYLFFFNLFFFGTPPPSHLSQS